MDRNAYKRLARRYDVKARAQFLVGFFNSWRSMQRFPVGSIEISPEVVYDVVLNYFADIDRAKKFHRIKRVNKIKIAAYTASWWMRLRPIQILKVVRSLENEILLSNEYFVLDLILSIFYDRSVLNDETDAMTKLLRDYLYHLRHRYVDPQVLELAIQSLHVTSPFPPATNPHLKED